jgi:hypothetical protein
LAEDSPAEIAADCPAAILGPFPVKRPSLRTFRIGDLDTPGQRFRIALPLTQSISWSSLAQNQILRLPVSSYSQSIRPKMKVQLLSRTPATSGERATLSKLPAVLGRNPDADVYLDDLRVSRVHCEISELSGTLLVRDLDSRNGTLVNGQYVKQAHLLPGDRLTVGLTSFEVHYRRSRRKSLLCVDCPVAK